jgi:hypothetical protein
MFALTLDTRPLTVSLKREPSQAEALRAEHQAVRAGYHLNKRHWINVMRPLARDTSVPFNVLEDGERPGAAHGLDVDEQGNGTVSQQRLYQLIRQRGSMTDRTFEITSALPASRHVGSRSARPGCSHLGRETGSSP